MIKDLRELQKDDLSLSDLNPEQILAFEAEHDEAYRAFVDALSARSVLTIGDEARTLHSRATRLIRILNFNRQKLDTLSSNHPKSPFDEFFDQQRAAGVMDFDTILRGWKRKGNADPLTQSDPDSISHHPSRLQTKYDRSINLLNQFNHLLQALDKRI